MRGFTLYPAIDLRAGRVVRLTQGDPARQTIYSHDPAQAARRWLEAGTAWLHVVNLDGALEQPDAPNQAALQTILSTSQGFAPVNPKIQYGGGVRTLEDIQRLLAVGVWRVILGTAVVQSTSVLAEALDRFGPERIAVALDGRDGLAQVRGWQETSGLEVAALAEKLSRTGLRTLIYTNVRRDGTGQGVDIATARDLASRTGLEVIASGGVSSLEDIRQVCSAGLQGLIIGRALYDGRIDLKEALSWLQHA